jgi:hypothetical protein
MEETMTRRTILLLGALVALVLVGLPALTAAQEEAGTIVKTGSLFADTGGAENSWAIAIPEGETAIFTLEQTNLPCYLGAAPKRTEHTEYRGMVGVKVLQDDKVGYSVEMGEQGCSQVLEWTSSGTPATVVVYNYQEGFTADYKLTMEGATLLGEPAAAEATTEVVVPAAEPATGRGF